MNNRNNPSLNVNLLGKGKKGNCFSILSNLSNRNRKIITLQNNLNFNQIINSHKKKNKKKLIFEMNMYKKEKIDYYGNNDIKDINDININNNKENDKKDLSLIALNNKKNNYKIKEGNYRNSTNVQFLGKSEYNFDDLNISTDYTSTEKKYNSKSVRKNKNNHLSLDISNKNNFYEKIKSNNQSQSKDKNKSINILNDVQKRMSFLLSDLINYIELLKKDKYSKPQK